MDSRRFDELTRRVGSGHSRRSILKSLLGLGGAAASAAVIPEAVDARTIRTRPTVPPPPPSECQLPMQMCGGQCCAEGHCKVGLCCPNATDVLCGGVCCASGLCTDSGVCCTSGDKICGAACCPASTECAISGNQDICCDPAISYPCGLECCTEPGQCCDGECCSGGAVCLSAIFGFEEYCCPVEQTCDGQCCDGVCYTPVGSGALGYDRSCCPAAAGATFCPGSGAYAGVATCCSDAAPDCCVTAEGLPVCLTTEQCCTSAECGHLTDSAECLEGICTDFSCETQRVCGDGETCCQNGDNTCCPPSQTCCGPTCCSTGLACCGRDVQGEMTFTCYNAAAEGSCCLDDECSDSPATCEEGVCRADQTCALITTCASGERCCEGDEQTAGECRAETLCCTDDECSDDPENCLEGVCEAGGCQLISGCGDTERCCLGGCIYLDSCCESSDCDAFERCLDNMCVCGPPYVVNSNGDCVQCDDDEEGDFNCVRFGFDTECVDCINGVCSPADDLGEDCELNESGNQGYCLGNTGICVPCLGSGVTCTAGVQCCGEVECAGNVCGGTSTTPDPSCSGVECEPNEVCSAGACQCPSPYVVNSGGDCVQCDSNDDDGDENCELFGFNTECVDCINGACSPADDLGDDCELDTGDQGYCLGDTGICVPCLANRVVCTFDNQCCDEDCFDGYCGGPPECANNDDCGPCEFCDGGSCISFNCTSDEGCCGDTQFCDEETGFCEACGQIGGDCSGFPFLPCCGDLLCSSLKCDVCVHNDDFGCEDFADCCDGEGSKFCRDGACRCGTPTLYNICSRDGDECCDQYACVTTQESANPLRGTCTTGTCSSTVGGSCPCCAGFFCASDNTCVNACNFSTAC